MSADDLGLILTLVVAVVFLAIILVLVHRLRK
jgi:hypothetical protein